MPITYNKNNIFPILFWVIFSFGSKLALELKSKANLWWEQGRTQEKHTKQLSMLALTTSSMVDKITKSSLSYKERSRGGVSNDFQGCVVCKVRKKGKHKKKIKMLPSQYLLDLKMKRLCHFSVMFLS